MTDPIQDAMAGAYADAARIIKELADEQLKVSMAQYARGIDHKATEWASKQMSMAYHDLCIRAAVVAAKPDLIGVEPWSPPENRPDGYECLIALRAKWSTRHGAWIVDDGDGFKQLIRRNAPTAFAPPP